MQAGTAFLVPNQSCGCLEIVARLKATWLQIGGLSGEPLREMATDVLREMYQLTRGEIPIIACGGVSNGYHAYEKIKAGETHCALYVQHSNRLF